MSTVKKFREGSMGAAEWKNQKIWVPALAGLFLITYCLFWFGGNLLPHFWFERAENWVNVVATVSSIGHVVVFVWRIRKLVFQANSLPGSLILLFCGWGAFNWAILGGFEFSY